VGSARVSGETISSIKRIAAAIMTQTHKSFFFFLHPPQRFLGTEAVPTTLRKWKGMEQVDMGSYNNIPTMIYTRASLRLHCAHCCSVDANICRAIRV
jgi:hypothetical protein